MRTLLYVEVRSLINGLRRTLASPKSWVPTAFLLLGVIMALGMSTMAAIMMRLEGHRPLTLNANNIEAIQAVVFVILAVFSVYSLLRATSDATLVFQMAEVDFLFPSPVPRRTVLLWRLMRNYLTTAIGTAVLALMILPMVLTALGVDLFKGLVGVWLVITVLGIGMANISHTLNLILTTRLEIWSAALGRVRTAAYSVFGLLIIGAFALGSLASDKLVLLTRSGSWLEAVSAASHSLFVRIIFLPAALATDLMILPLKPSGYSPLIAGAGLLVFAGGSLAVLLARRENIYEPSLGVSVRIAQLMQARKRGDASALTQEAYARVAAEKNYASRIPPFGQGAAAILWKNAVISARSLKPVQLLSIVVFAAVYVGLRVRSGHSGSSDQQTMWWIYALFIIGRISQSAVRQELRQNWLKTMPIRGWKVMTAETLCYTAAAALSLLLILGIFGFAFAGSSSLRWLPFIPSLAAALAASGNLGAVLYPNLTDLTHNFLSGLVATLLSAVPFVATVTIEWLFRTLGLTALLAVIVVTLGNLVYAAVMVAAAGHLYDRFDPTSE